MYPNETRHNNVRITLSTQTGFTLALTVKKKSVTFTGRSVCSRVNVMVYSPSSPSVMVADWLRLVDTVISSPLESLTRTLYVNSSSTVTRIAEEPLMVGAKLP